MQVIVNCPERSEANISIMDISGRIVYKEDKKLNKGINTVIISSVKDWLPGSYVIKLFIN